MTLVKVVSVDSTRCQGHARCLASAPDAFEFDDEGYSYVPDERSRFKELPEICRKCPDWQVKRANAYFPNPEARSDYEGYIRTGRVFMQQHDSLAAAGILDA